MKTVMVSGHFDPFTDAHLDYLKQAFEIEANVIYCVVSSDRQVLTKKRKVNIAQKGRHDIVYWIMVGLGYSYRIPFLCQVNKLDSDTSLANELRWYHPTIFLRGGDKTLDDMPLEERQVCEELGIEIRHAEFRIDRHGSDMVIGREL